MRPYRLRWVATALTLALVAPVAANPWAKVRAPAPGEAQSIGRYTAGCLIGGEALADDEPGIIHMRPHRVRNFGHPDLLGFLRDLAGYMSAKRNKTLLVGDLGMPRGGPTLTNHVSHQSGLDVDVWFDLLESGAALNGAQRRDRPAGNYVNWRARKLRSNWTADQSAMVVWSARRPEVERIFVNPVIKRHLCDSAPAADRAWLRKVRPWWGHADHLHVRLRCPPLSRGCQAQKPPPDGEGCGDSLTWWLTRAEAERDAARKKNPKKKAPRMPKLPLACAAALQSNG